jgi:hypothetical protein
MDLYLRLEEHICCLLADRRPPRLPRITPEQARTFRMAALFRAAAPGAAEPTPAFRARLIAAAQRLSRSPFRSWWPYSYVLPLTLRLRTSRRRRAAR